MALYIDTCSYNDYDTVVRFLLNHQVEILSRNKMKMIVSAEMSADLANQMQDECDFEEAISIGEKPLGGEE